MRIGHQQSSFPPFLFPNGKQSATHKKFAPATNEVVTKQTTFKRPAINKDAFAATLSNYRIFVGQANAQIDLLNKEVRSHNKTVKTPTKTLQQFVKLFQGKDSHLEPEDYNKEVDNFCSVHGQYLRKKNQPTIKPSAEIVFAGILHLYSAQLRQLCNRRDTHNIQYAMSLPRVEVNTEFLSKLQRDGLSSMNFCKKTLRNHRSRLEKIGVLQDYEYHGTQKPVDYRINPSILAVAERETPRILNTENQPVNLAQGKKLPDNDVDTRTNLKNQEIKGNVQKSTFPDKDVAAQRPFKIVFYKSNQPQDAKKANQGPREICKKTAKNLEKAVNQAQNFKPGAQLASQKNGIPAVIPVYEHTTITHQFLRKN